MATLSLYPAAQFTTGELLSQTALNAPLQLIQNWSTTIDHTNIGSAGIYASQILATSTAQGTFGSGTGYTFSPASTSAVPLTITSPASATVATLAVNMGSSQSAQGMLISGASGITSPPFQVNLTGAALAFSVDQNANVTLGTSGGTRTATTTVCLLNDGATTNGLEIGIPSGSTNGVRIFASTTQILQIQANGSTTSGTSGTISSGGFNWGTSAGNGLTQVGSSSSSVQTVTGSSLYLFNNNATAFMAVDGSGDLGIAGTLHQSSARSMKKNIEPFVGDALRDVLAVKAYRYHFNAEEDDVEKHVGFIADEAPRSLYRKGPSGKPEDVAVDPYWLSVVNMIAIQQLHAKLDTILEGKLSAS